MTIFNIVSLAIFVYAEVLLITLSGRGIFSKKTSFTLNLWDKGVPIHGNKALAVGIFYLIIALIGAVAYFQLIGFVL